MLVTGSSLPQQLHEVGSRPGSSCSGHFEFGEDSSLDFGVSLTKVKNRSAFSNVQRDTWGGVGTAGGLPGRRLASATASGHYFGSIAGSSSPALFNQFFTCRLRDGARRWRPPADRRSGAVPGVRRVHDGPPDRRGRVARARTCSTAPTWTPAMPLHVAVGLRYEKTDVTSTRAGADRHRHHLGGQQRVLDAVRRRRASPRSRAATTTCCPASTSSVDLSDDMKLRAQLRRDHRPAGLGRHPGRADPERSSRASTAAPAHQGNPA